MSQNLSSDVVVIGALRVNAFLQAACKDDGAKLVEIETAGENQYLAECLKSMYIIKVKNQTTFFHYVSQPNKSLSLTLVVFSKKISMQYSQETELAYRAKTHFLHPEGLWLHFCKLIA